MPVGVLPLQGNQRSASECWLTAGNQRPILGDGLTSVSDQKTTVPLTHLLLDVGNICNRCALFSLVSAPWS